MRRYEKKDAYKHNRPICEFIFILDIFKIFHNFKLYANDFANQRYVFVICSEHLQGICWLVGLQLVTNQESTF